MNRHRFITAFEAVIVLVFCAGVCSCISAPPPPPRIFTYDANRQIYPAVWEYFAKQNDRIEMIDPYNDEVATGLILEYSTGSGVFRYKLKIMGKEGIIRSTIERQYQDNDRTWKSTSSSSPEAQKALEAISALVQSPDYEQRKQNVDKDLSFNFFVLRDLTELGRESWFNEHMKRTEFDMDLSLMSANKNTSSDSRKRYVAGFYHRAESLSDRTLDDPTARLLPDETSGFSIAYYTDDERFATMRPGTRVRVRAKLIQNSTLTTDKTSTFIRNGQTILPGTIFVLPFE